MTKKQPYTNKYAHKPKLSKEEVATELLRMQSEGHSMKTPDFEMWFYRRIQEHFGSYTKAKTKLGITPVRNNVPYVTTEARRRRDLARQKYTGEELALALKAIATKYETLSDIYNKEKAITSAITRRYKSLQDFAKEEGITLPEKRNSKVWDDSTIAETLSKVVMVEGTTSSTKLMKKGHRGVVDAVKRRYGTWSAGLVALGYEVAKPSTQEEVRQVVLCALANGMRPNMTELIRNVKGFNSALNKLFDGYAAFKEYAGYCEISDKPKPHRKYCVSYRTKEGIQREILRMWYIGAPLNYNAVSKRRGGMITAANELIGSWRQAVESVGINYADITKASDTNVLSECGTEFETLFAEILTELNYAYIREGEGLNDVLEEGFALKPDFILPNWRWLDCKLSEWTDASEMLKKYQAFEPNGISIVYLRGRKQRKQRGKKWRYEHVSVYCFTEQLTQDRRKYYEDKLNEIAIKADEGAIAN